MYALHWLRKMNNNAFKDMGVESEGDYHKGYNRYDSLDKAKAILKTTGDVSARTSGADVKLSADGLQSTIVIYSEKYGEIVHIYTIVEV